MPHHKVKGLVVFGREHEWCTGSGEKPLRSEVVSERPDTSVREGAQMLGEYDDILDWKEPLHAV